ncbi:MAG: hypothetical protein HN350_03235 [Phycisphaerales bacterium]|jgi:hypothetical protein|nr:hypothetical protein [Phycisphaerales bacterium]
MKNAKLAIVFTVVFMTTIAIIAGCNDEKPVQSVDTANAGQTVVHGASVVGPVVTGKPTRVPKVELIIAFPKAACAPTPVPIKEPNIAKLRPAGVARPVIMVPKGAVNLALGKPVTSNEILPVIGELKMVTDGEKSGEDGYNVDLGFGRKWVQIDLDLRANLYGVSLWHYHKGSRAYRDVIIEVADDEDFTENVQIVFNSDHDNSYGKGIGDNMGYVETNEGKFIYCPKGTTGRYVRLHSQGNTSNDQNHYVEVEIYGTPVK